MKIETRKIVTKQKIYKDENTGKEFKYNESYENGFVETLDIDINDISVFSLNKKVRMIGIGKDTYLLTLKSWKELKKQINKLGLMHKFDFSKAS